jgi:hypothetical protein
MEPIHSHVNLNDAEHKANRAAMDQVLASHRKSLQETLKCGRKAAAASNSVASTDRWNLG